jgi:DNA-binding HxlR family transcriptional regulator
VADRRRLPIAGGPAAGDPGGEPAAPVAGGGGDPRRAPRKLRRGAVESAPDLDRLIHERIRLGIVSALAVDEVVSFTDLRRLLKTTDGNLSVHARKLEEAGYVRCDKFFDGRTPKTEYRLTAAGRRALERYLGHMEAIIRATRAG